MGSQIDAVKLVSCMTLFEHVAKRVGPADPQPRFTAMGAHAVAILTAAARQGYRRCGFTEQHLGT